MPVGGSITGGPPNRTSVESLARLLPEFDRTKQVWRRAGLTFPRPADRLPENRLIAPFKRGEYDSTCDDH